MNDKIKSFYLTYNGRVATPNFPNDEGVETKVVALLEAFSSLGCEMELHADLIYRNEQNEQQ